MKTKITAKEARKLPISKKAYECFVERIRSVSAKFIGDPAPFIRILDQYLAGEREYLYMSATYEMRIAFEMLRPEIDRAIERSRRARERALARRKNNEPADNDAPADNATPTPTAEEEQNLSIIINGKNCASGENLPESTVIPKRYSVRSGITSKPRATSHPMWDGSVLRP